MTPATPTGVPSSPLIGRAHELGTLRAVVDQVAGGNSQFAFVEGEAGIGKSRLLAEAVHAAECRGVTVFQGKADELHTERPFGAIADALECSTRSTDPKRAAIGALLSDRTERSPDASDGPEPQFQVVDALAELLEETAMRNPIVVIDDLQWADHATLLTVRAIAARLGALPIGLIGAYRSLPRNPTLDGIVHAAVRGGASHMLLSSLGPGEVAEIVGQHLGAKPGPYSFTGSPPQRGTRSSSRKWWPPCSRTEAIALSTGWRTWPTKPVSASAADHRRRMSGLPHVTVETLRAAAILGATFDVADLVMTMGRTALDLSSILSEPLRARILEGANDKLRFRHDLISDAIYAELPLGLRRALHGGGGPPRSHRLAGSTDAKR